MLAWFILSGVLLIALWAICIYNRLVTLRNDMKNAWHQIDVQLKRRHDLIPNLVSVVRGFMDFERDTLERVTAARSMALGAVSMRDRASAEVRLTQALGALFAVMERYPELKSNENAMHLQEELVSTENRIAFSRQHYNDLVANYMTRREVFPDAMISSFFGFPAAEYFFAGAADREVPSAGLNAAS